MKKIKNAKGITLIALIITIIVLLILAAITLSTLAGRRGIINQAQNAEKEHTKAAALEDITLVTYQSLDNKGNTDTTKLEQGLNDIGATILEKTETMWIVELNGYTFEVDIEEGDVKEHTGPISEVPLKPSDDIANENTEFIADYGTIEVIWLKQTTNTVATEPNAPNLYSGSSALQPVTWTYNSASKTWTEDATAKSTWYDYTEGDGKADNLTSMWANAKNTDGSYFVWIPRYAYRITYYSDEEYNNVTGYYDGYGMWKAEDGSKKYDLDEGIETVEYNGKKYIVHPAFTSNVDNGGWGKNTSGFWTAIYEMSREGATDTLEGSENIFYSVPGVKITSCSSMTDITLDMLNIGDLYSYSFDYDRDKESHLMKNSEWGAVAYLTHSQYGRNGNEIDFNKSTISGNGSGASARETIVNKINNYNTEVGAKASSTGNIYGVYDLSGGYAELMSGFNKYGDTTCLEGSDYGLNMTKEAKDKDGNYISTKYITLYSNKSDDQNKVREVGKIGDATKEVRKTSKGLAWFNELSWIHSTSRPFIDRGAYWAYSELGNSAGLFHSEISLGQYYVTESFRVVLGEL